MKCIVGLGNPGRKYKNTRHNIGFNVIDELLSRHNWQLNKSKFKGKYTIEQYQGEKILLLQPQTFMNLSGEALSSFVDYYQLNIDNILVVYDDLDLPIGRIRLRKKGGHGGHNGIRSIIDQLGTRDFKRLRIGVGRPTQPISVVDYVLGTFSKDQREDAKLGIQLAADACEAWFPHSFADVMNQYNK